MNIYLHIYGRRDPKQFLVWMGDGPEDGMNNFRRLADHKPAGIDAKSHIIMIDITDQILAHFPTTQILEQDDPFRPLTLYAALCSMTGQELTALVIEAPDLDRAIERFQFKCATSSFPAESLQRIVNLGDGLAILKEKIAKWFASDQRVLDLATEPGEGRGLPPAAPDQVSTLTNPLVP